MRLHKIHTQRGFTILEVMLSVMIIGIMALLAIPRILDTDRRAAYITAHQIVADMRLARTNAVTNVEKYLVKFYPDGAGWGPYTGYRIFRDGDETDVDKAVKSVKIPDQLTVNAAPGSAGRWPPELVFTSLGSIEDGTNWVILHVTGGGHQVNIKSTYTTGKVSIQ